MRYLDIRGVGLGGYVGVNLFFFSISILPFYCSSFITSTLLRFSNSLKRCEGFPIF